MKKLILVAIVIFLLYPLSIFAQDDYTGVINTLRDKDPNNRVAAANILGLNGVKTAVWALIQTLNDENEPVRIAALKALEQITHIEQSPGLDYKKWMEWWEASGKSIYSIEALKDQKFKLLEDGIKKLGGDIELLKKEQGIKLSEDPTKKLSEYLKQFEDSVKKLSEDIDTLKRDPRVKLLEDSTKKLSEDIETLKKEGGIKPLEDSIKKLTEYIETLKEQIKPLENSAKELTEEQKRIKSESVNIEGRIRGVESRIQLYMAAIAVVAILFILVTIYFTGVASSRLKSWKETIKQAEFYIKESEEITKRTDKILDELEGKRAEIMEFVSKVKEESQSDVERFSELLETNLEHKMRETMMGLREKAEKEVEQTLGELKTQVEHEIKRIMADYKDKNEKDFKTREAEFTREVEVNLLFIEASFYFMNGKPAEALKHYNKLLAIKPNHYVAWTNKGTILRELGRYEEAIDSFNKASELAPDDSSIYYNVAATYAKMRRKDKMLVNLTRAFQNDGEYKDEAINDISFREYWNDPAFRNLTEV